MNFETWEEHPKRMRVVTGYSKKFRLTRPIRGEIDENHVTGAKITQNELRRVHTMVKLPGSDNVEASIPLFLSLQKLRTLRRTVPSSATWGFWKSDGSSNGIDLPDDTEDRVEGIKVSWNADGRRGRVILKGRAFTVKGWH